MLHESIKTKQVWPVEERNIHGVFAVARLQLDMKVTWIKEQIESGVPDPIYLQEWVYAKRKLEHDVYQSLEELRMNLLQAVRIEPPWSIRFTKIEPVGGWDPYQHIFDKLQLDYSLDIVSNQGLVTPICKTEQITVIEED